MSASDSDCYILENGTIDSGASTTFVTSQRKISNSSQHKSQLQTPSRQKCYTTHLGKTTLLIGSKALYLPELLAPMFKKDIISVA